MLRKASRLKASLTGAELAFLTHACGSIERLLPHVNVLHWEEAAWQQTESVWQSIKRTEIRFIVGIKGSGDSQGRSLRAVIRRRKDGAASGIAKEVLDLREHQICSLIANEIEDVLGHSIQHPEASLPAMHRAFDEIIVAKHLVSHHSLNLSISDVLDVMHTLAEQTYENKSLAFGCVIEPRVKALGKQSFPREFIKSKKFKALSDGFRTAYVVSGNGAVIRFVDLHKYALKPLNGKHFYPEWAEPLARSSRAGRCGIALSRQGDILVFDEGTLRFTYRYGRWQYWNHNHLINLLRDKARAQRVPKKILGSVVGAIYRAALDVAFRRSGALFVILHNKNSIDKIVKMGDALGHKARSLEEQEFDLLLKNKRIQSISRIVAVELASLDGAVVLDNSGAIRAYGAVLQPKKVGKLKGTEGSRTKAAIGASNYGIAVKISSDGDITIYHAGKEYLKV